MNKEDIIFVKKLIKLSNIILTFYQTLYKLEIENKLNSDEYQTTLKKLNSYLELENELYGKFLKDPDKLYYYSKYIYKINEASILTDYELLIDGTPLELSKKRIFNKLQYLKKEYPILIYQKSYNGPEGIVPIDSKFYLNQNIQNDFLSLFIFEVEDLINNNECKNYQDNLKEIKYLIAYLNPTAKISLKKGDYLFLNSKSISTILGINNFYHKYAHKFLRTYFLNYIKPALISILGTKDCDYQNKEEIIRVLINISLIKSYLEFEYKEFKSINQEFHDIMELYNKNNKISVTILNKLLNCKPNSKIVMMELRGIYENENSRKL